MGLLTWMQRQYRKCQTIRRPSSPEARLSRRLELEVLESREVPTTRLWSGGGILNNNWSNPGNWIGNVAPKPGDDLVFSAGVPVASLNNSNDFAAGTAFNTITIASSNYTLGGNAITLGNPTVPGSGSVIVNSGATGGVINFDIQLGGPGGSTQFFTINSSASLTMAGRLSGTTGSSLTKGGTGTLTLANDNSGYSGQIKIANNSGVLVITNALALGSTSAGTTVGAGSQLQISNIPEPILEPLTLGGLGLANDGALINIAGNDTWAGPISLDSDVFIGVAAGTLTITGQISDLGAGHNLSKEGAGQLIFARDNTYRGLTSINNGILTIQHPLALGTAGTAANGTIVNRSIIRTGTLQVEDPTGVGFIVLDELLTLNGPGAANQGSLRNLLGDNEWAANITLGSLPPNGTNVRIGVNAATAAGPSSLLISGVIDNPNGSFDLSKVGTGRLIFNNANLYDSNTTVVAGILTIRDSNALGTGAAAITVSSGAALELEVETAPMALVDPHGRDLTDDSTTRDAIRLSIAKPLSISGLGAGGGVFRSISGINVYTGGITLTGGATGLAGIGVDPDPSPEADNTYFTNDYSLTVTGNIAGGAGLTFVKTGQGHLILPNGNGYTSLTNIAQGWVTIQNNQSLGGRIGGRGDTVQPGTNVSAGAALHLKPLTLTSPPLILPENLTLSGLGVAHPFTGVGGIGNKGVLMSLGGDNVVSGDINLIGNVGVGSEFLTTAVAGDPGMQAFPDNGELTTTGLISGLAAGPMPPPLEGGFSSGGPWLSTIGTHSHGPQVGELDFGTLDEEQRAVAEFDLSTTFSASSAILTFVVTAVTGSHNFDIDLVAYIGDNVLNVADFSAGTIGAGPLLSLNSGALTVGQVLTADVTNVFNLQAGASLGLRLQATSDPGDGSANFTVSFGNFSLTLDTSISGSGITKLGSKRLNIQGEGTYDGDVRIREGVLRIQNDTALGTAIGNTIVEAGTALELAPSIPQLNGGLQAGLQVWNERLILNGTGNTDFNLMPLSSLSNDSMWRGPVTLNNDLTFDLRANTRLTLFDIIDDAGNPNPSGSTLTKTGTGELFLAGTNTYRGTTLINQGIVTIANSRALGTAGNAEVQLATVSGTTGFFTLTFKGQTTAALQIGATAGQVETALNALSSIRDQSGDVSVAKAGNVYTITFGGGLFGLDQPLLIGAGTSGAAIAISPSLDGAGGTVVADGAQLQLQGSLTVGGESLVLQGAGAATIPNVPLRWFDAGPEPILNGQVPNNTPVAGRVTGVAVDPSDPNVIYISAAGGGAWKTKNGGKTWTQLFDAIAEVQRITLTGAASGTFTLTFGGQTTGPLPANASREQVEAALNALSSIGGVGGQVSVARTNNGYVVTFAGTLAGLNQPPLIATASGGAVAAVTTLADGGDDNSIIYGGAIVISPSDPRILYLGTGEGNNSADSFYGRGVYKSTDSGKTWTLLLDTVAPVANPLDTQAINRIVIDPGDPNVIYVASSDQAVNSSPSSVGVWRYDGTEWLNLTTITSFERDPATAPMGTPTPPPGTPGPDDDYRINFPMTNASWSDLVLLNGSLYAALGTAVGDLPNGVFVCVNPDTAMATGPNRPVWYVGDRVTDSETAGEFPVLEPVPPPRPPLYGNIKITAVTNPAGFHTIYAAVANVSGTLRTIQRSDDSGRTWSEITALPPNYMGTQGWFDSTILAVNQDTVYVAGQTMILVTTDGGATWIDISVDGAGNGPHVDYHATTLDNNGDLLVGTDGGVWRYDVANAQWFNLNGNLAITTFMGIASHPSNLNIALGGSQDNGTEIFNGQQAWNLVDLGDGGTVHFDPQDPSIAYHVLNGRLRKSTDGGLTWVNAGYNGGAGLYFPFIVDTINPARLLLGGGDLVESLDRATTYTSLQPPISVGAIGAAVFQGPFVPDTSFPFVTDKLANTYDPDTIYVASLNGTSVYVTKDHGQTWDNRSPFFFGFGGGSITDIAVDPTNRETVYICLDGLEGAPGTRRVFRTTNGGRTWTDFSAGLADLPAWRIVIDPRSNTLYLGTDSGVWFLPSGASTWQRFGFGMPNVQVHDIDLNQSLNTLTAGTYGRSMYQFFLGDLQANSGALRAISGSPIWAGPVLLAGPTTISAAGTQGLNNGIASATLTIVDTISDLIPGGNHRLTKDGPGDVVLAGNNTYGGVTEIKNGVLVVQNRHALGSASGETIVNNLVNPNTALELQSDLEEEPLTLAGDGISFNGHFTGALRNVSGNNTYTGVITMLANTTIGADSGSSLTIGTSPFFNGPGIIRSGVGGPWSLTKELTGTLILASANSYDGQTNVNQGVLNVQHANALGTDGTAANGTVVLDGAQLQLQGGVTVANERLQISGSGIFGTGAVLNVSGANTWSGPVILAMDAGFAPVTTPPTDVVFGVDEVNPTDQLSINGVISHGATGQGVTKVGPGTLIFSQANTYVGLTTVSQGTLRIQNSAALGTTAGRTTVAAGAAVELDGDPTGVGASINVAESISLNGLGVGPANQGALINFTGNNTWAGPVTLQTAAGVGVTATTDFTVTGLVQDPSPAPVPAASLTKVGAGTLVLPNGNTYTGATFVNEGVLNIRSAAALGGLLSEVQTVTVGGASGTFTLNFNGQNTTPLDVVSATAGQVETALNALSTIGGVGGNVVVTKSGNVFTITFSGSLALVDLPQLTTATTGAATAAANTLTHGGGVEAQTVTVAGATGTFRLTFNGQTTAALPVNSTAADVQTALNNLSSVALPATVGGPARGFTIVTKTGNVFTISFSGILAGVDLPQMTATTTGAASVTLNTVVNGGGLEVQTITLAGSSGTFTATFGGQTTGPLPFLAPAADVEAALNVLSTIGGVGGSVSVTLAGFVYTVVFGGSLTGQNLPQMTVAGTGGLAVSAQTQRNGLEGTTVASGATLQVQGGITIPAESLTLSGTGFNSAGALQNAGGNNTWAKSIVLAGNSFIGVDDPTETLVVNQPITDNNPGFGVIKVGPGTLDFAGNTSNTYRGITLVNEGTLLLDKSGGAVALNNNLTIGDGLPGNATVRWLFPDQVPDGAVVLVQSDGLLDLNDLTETIGPLTISGGTARTGTGANGSLSVTSVTMTAGHLTTGTAGSQVLLGGNINILADPNTAFIDGSGSVDLGGVTRTFTVADGASASDLTVTSAVVNGGLTKSGAGTLTLESANHTYAGATTLQSGRLLVNGTLPNSDVTVSGGTLGGSGSVKSLTVTNGNVAPGNSPGVLTSGPVILSGSTTFTVDLNGDTPGNGANNHDQLVVNGPINLGGAVLAGNLGFSPTANTTLVIVQATGTISGAFAQGNGLFLDGQKFAITIDNASATKTVTLTKGKSTTTTQLSSITPNPAIFGQVVTLTAVVTPEAGAAGTLPTGLVTFRDGNTTLGTGVVSNIGGVFTATLIIPAGQLLAGVHTLSATYDIAAADNNLSGSTSATVSLTVSRVSSFTTITQANPNPSAFGQEVVFTVQVTPSTAGVLPTGTLTFMEGTTVLGTSSALTNVGGIATATFTAPSLLLTRGTHTIFAMYAGDANYAASTSSNFTQTVNPALTVSTITQSSARPSIFGQPITFTVTVASLIAGPLPTGTLTFRNGNTILGISSPLTNVGGKATATFQAVSGLLNVGTHMITAQYTGDATYAASTSPNFLQAVKQAASSATITKSSGTPSNLDQPVTFTVVVSQAQGAVLPTGTVTFREGATILGTTGQLTNVGGLATATFVAPAGRLTRGTHSVFAVYNGNANYSSSASPIFVQTVNQATSTTTITSGTPNPSNLNQPVTFTITVGPTLGATLPTGTLTIRNGATALGTSTSLVNVGGIATATFVTTGNQLSGGPNSITASFAGDNNYNAGTSAPFTQNVNRINGAVTSITSATPSNPVFGINAVTIVAHVTGSVLGLNPAAGSSVTFRDGATDLGSATINANGDATFTTSVTQLNGGTRSLTAVWGGDGNYNGSTSSPASVTVAKANSRTTVATTNASAGFGGATITATVTAAPGGAGIPAGNVTFAVTNTATNVTTNSTVALDSSGIATLGPLNPGSYTIVATFNGASSVNFNSSTSSSISQTINKANATVGVTSSAGTTVFGQSVTFTATVTPVASSGGTPTGTVTFIIDGVQQSPVALSNGQATFQTNSLNAATAAHSVQARYDGNANFNVSTGTLANGQTVNKANTLTTVTASPPTTVFGQNVTFTATVSVAAPGSGTVTGTATFIIDSTTVATNVPVVNGTATFQVNSLLAGTLAHTVQVNFTSISANLNGSTGTLTGGLVVTKGGSTTTVTASTLNPVVGRSVTVTATVTAAAGPVSPTGSVTFFVDGVARPAVALNGSGQAALAVTFSTTGAHTVQAVYSGDTNSSTSNGTITLTAGSLNQAFVAQMFRDLLQREVDAGSLANLTAALDGGLSRVSLVQSIQNSREYRTVQVKDLYLKYLQRAADTSGLNSLTDFLMSGKTVESAAATLIGSTEYFVNRGLSTNSGFLDALYPDTLGRPADAQGKATWLSNLNTLTRQQVAGVFLGTAEYYANLTRGLFLTFLRRAATDANVSATVALFQQGARQEAIIANLVASQEYFDRL